MRIKAGAVLAVTAIAVAAVFSPFRHAEAAGKNKPLAILLSFVSPGMGQMYEGDIEKGLAIWGGTTVLSYALIMSVSDIDLTSLWIPSPRFSLQNAPTANQWFWASGIAATLAILYVYNIVDVAVNVEKEDAPLSVTMGSNSVSLNCSFRY